MNRNTSAMTRQVRREHAGPDPGNLMVSIYTLVIGLSILFGSRLPAAAVEEHGVVESTSLSVEDVHRGELLVPDATGSPSPALQLGQDAAITISGIVARVRVSQEFANTGTAWVDGVYVFPLPDESAVDRLRMKIGEREIVGEIKERQEAKAIYEQARAEGRKTSLLAQNRPNIFTSRVANIGPGEKVSIIIEYQQLVEFHDNIFSLRFPMSITPRYIPGRVTGATAEQRVSFTDEGWAKDTDQVVDASQITPPVASPESGKGPTTTLTVDLMSGFPVTGLQSLYHQMAIRRLSEDHHTLAFTGKVLANRDFVLEWQAQKSDTAIGALLAEDLGDHRYFLLMLLPPQNRYASDVPREVVFLLDVSGSMAGPSIAQAKTALRQALQRLKPADRFNVIAFSNSAHSFFARSMAATGEYVQEALEQLEQVQAEGGTEMRAALEMALDGGDAGGRIRQVIFLTDGAVGNEEELLTLIHRRLGQSRLFTVGIGSAPNNYFMTRAAAIGRGTHTAIGDVAEVQQRMAALLTRLENPALTDISIAAAEGGPIELECYPAPIPDLYFGEPLMVALRTGKNITGLSITGEQNGTRRSLAVDTGNHGSRPGIGPLWARKKIRSEMGALALGKDEAEVRKQVLATALEHRLVSKYTSLVAVDQLVSRPQGQPTVKAAVQVAAPFGLQMDKVFGGGAQTATPAAMELLIGFGVLILAVLLTSARRRIR